MPFDFRNPARHKREKESSDLYFKLLDEGYPPDAAKFIIDRKQKTGVLDLELPTYQNPAMQGVDTYSAPPADEVGLKNRLPMWYPQRGGSPNRPVPLPPVTDIPERSALVDFQPMRPKEIAGMQFNRETGKYESLMPPESPQPVFLYDESGALKHVGDVPKGSRVAPKPKATPVDPIEKALKERKAQKWLEDRGAPVTPGNIKAVLEKGLVEE